MTRSSQAAERFCSASARWAVDPADPAVIGRSSRADPRGLYEYRRSFPFVYHPIAMEGLPLIKEPIPYGGPWKGPAAISSRSRRGDSNAFHQRCPATAWLAAADRHALCRLARIAHKASAASGDMGSPCRKSARLSVNRERATKAHVYGADASRQVRAARPDGSL